MRDLESLPEPRRDAVREALRAALGVRSAGSLIQISGGVSGAFIGRFEASGRAYLLRLEPERIPLADRRRGFSAMTAAAAVGVAPRVHHADPASGVAIMDFVPGRPLSDYPGGPAAMATELGALVAATQTTPPFEDLGDYPQLIDALLTRLDASGPFAPGLLAPHRAGLARIRAALPWDPAALVSSHNDPNPRNILFDGRRLWLIDWELACRNDPLVDIAILTTDLFKTPDLEDTLLQAAFGRPPDDTLRARLGVVRLLTRLFYGAIVLDSLASAPLPNLDPTLAALSPAAFRQAVADGRLKSGTPEVAEAFARMSLAAFLDGLAAPDFDDRLGRAF